ncbi:MAG TPA: Hsp33 family molecular chaperone HslO [Gammaproteobacteria bacterium]|nr:Hsp33 family molecular chaperone HslO [Gammaproteobacteria bacterium]
MSSVPGSGTDGGGGDSLHRFLFEHFPVRGELVRLNATWRSVLERCDYPPPVRALLGEAMSAAALLSATIKFQGQLTLQIQGQGAVNLLVVQCNHNFNLRGLAHWHGPVQERGNLIGTARLVITIEQSESGERYQGIVEVDGDDIGAALETYFRQSEQLPTRLWLSSDERCAAGMLVQRLPGESADADAWNRVVTLAGTVRGEELRMLAPRRLLRRLFHEEELRLFEPRPVSFRCGCSRERIERVIVGMGQQEAESILADEGSIRVACEFCNKRYEFDRVDVEQLFSGATQAPPSSTRH